MQDTDALRPHRPVNLAAATVRLPRSRHQSTSLEAT